MNKASTKLLSVLIMALLLGSIFSAFFVNFGYASELVDDAKGIDVDTKTSNWVMTEPVQGPSHHSYFNVGDAGIWSYYDGFYGGIVFTYYWLEYADDNVEIWVQQNLNWGRPSAFTGTFPYPPEWRSNPPKGPTDLQLQYLASEWGNNILPEETEFFGAPLTHDGTNAQLPGLLGLPADYYTGAGNRQVILVCNIRDENYYLPNYGGPGVAYPYKIIGVHISEYEDTYYDRNVITIDAISFDRQCGPPGYTWPGAAGPVTSPYAYESTIAHEYQHLLHHELSPGDVTFMNEGCSMYAEFLCGYGIDPDYPNSYFATPDNSLTEWGDQGDINILADYGAAALWTMYLSDRFGPEFLRLYFLLGAYGVHGIEAIDYALYFSHVNEEFPDVYNDWRLANLIRADNPGAGKYNYKSLNLNDPVYLPVRVYTISGLPVAATKGTDFGNTITILGIDTGISRLSQWGTDYILFEDWNRPGEIYFDGDDTAAPPPPHLWTLTADGWYSGTGVDLANEAIVGNAYVDPSDATLTIVTKYGLETYWDFGFVQISTDGGATWVSLANSYTTTDHDPAAHPDVVANLPGLTGYNPDWPGWTTMSFDLTAYAGQTVMIGFHYITDWATTYEGWWINSAVVSGSELTLAPYVPSYTATFYVNTVSALVIDHKTLYVPNDMTVDAPANTGTAIEFAKTPNYVVMAVTPVMNGGTTDYQFAVEKLSIKIWNP
jgi:immune inhibitor A